MIFIQPFIPAASIAEDAATRRFIENPAVECEFCEKPTTTGLNHFDCELKNFCDDQPADVDLYYQDLVRS